MGKIQGGGKSWLTCEVIWEDMLGKWGNVHMRTNYNCSMHPKRGCIWLSSFKIKKQLSCKYMGRAKDNIGWKY